MIFSDNIRLIIGVLTIFIVVFYLFNSLFFKSKHVITSKLISRVAIFSSISTILYVVPYFKFALPFFPSFLEFHFDEVPALISGFAYGPVCAFFVILIKTLIKLPFSTSLAVGETADFIYSLAFVLPSCFIYKKNRSFKGAIIGLLISSLLQVVVASLITSFVILDFYMFVMGLSKETLIKMCQLANKNVTSLGWTFFFYFGMPFNILKDVFVIVITILLYKKMHGLIDKIKN